MADLFLMRHGQSVYNLQNRFTGDLDVPLTSEGIKEAKTAAT
jgi:2,3-bisphosphoglycerate-dependent phosphoglycerate mutase